MSKVRALLEQEIAGRIKSVEKAKENIEKWNEQIELLQSIQMSVFSSEAIELDSNQESLFKIGVENE